jgi:transketolase
MSALAPELQKKCVDTIRFLAADGVEKANSGHPGMPMGAAALAFTLWSRHLRFDPRAPRWAGRDRFVLSAGHGSMLIYSLLHLAGFDVTLDDLKSFRQLHSRTPGHPEFGETPGVECTTGPLGQGISNAVGFALSGKLLAARLNTPSSTGFTPINHFVYALAGDGCLMEGVSAEAASFAGHHQLGNLICFYDDNQITIEGDTSITFTEDRLARFAALGWHVQQVHDGNDAEAIDAAIRAAQAETKRPSLIAVRTVADHGAPHKAGTRHAHGEPLGKEEMKAAKEALGWPLEPTFLIPDEVRAVWAARIAENQAAADKWREELGRWASEHPELAALLRKLETRETPADLAQQLATSVAAVTAAESTRKLSQTIIQKAAELVPSMVGGSADLEPSCFTAIKAGGDVTPENFAARTLHFGVREHGMGAIVNGLAYDGFFLPHGSTFLVFSDYMRPPIRLASLSKLRSIFVFTHDSIFLGEDGPTHQPVEHLAALRTIPNLHVWRPADPVETAAAWSSALQRTDGPTVLSLTRQKVAPIARALPFDVGVALEGAYAVSDAGGTPEVVIVATGSELATAQAALKLLPAALKVRLVSMPCTEKFLAWPKAKRETLIPPSARCVAVEASGGLDWYRIVGRGLVCGIDGFGASAPEKALAGHFGYTPEKVAARITAWLAQ